MPMLRLAVCVCLLAFGLAGPALAEDAAIPGGRQFALVIGNNDYKHLPHLVTAVRDAEAVATLLSERYGFETTLLKNATRMRAIARQSIERSPADNPDGLQEGDQWLAYPTKDGMIVYLQTRDGRLVNFDPQAFSQPMMGLQ